MSKFCLPQGVFAFSWIEGAAGVSAHVTHPFHLHLRAQNGSTVLYAVPLSLSLCVPILQKYIAQRNVLILSFSPARNSRFVSLSQWLRRRRIQAHAVSPTCAMVSSHHLTHIARLPHLRLVFVDTTLSPEELLRRAGDLLEKESDDNMLLPAANTAVDNILHYESRADCHTQLTSTNREMVIDLLCCFLCAYLRSRLVSLPLEPAELTPAIKDQLWHYGSQGLTPQAVISAADTLVLKVALGTPDPSVCLSDPACQHVEQIRRGFILRLHMQGWDLCSTEDLDSPRQ